MNTSREDTPVITSVQVRLVLAIIAIGITLLAVQWHNAHTSAHRTRLAGDAPDTKPL
jgi:hypothetical protein